MNINQWHPDTAVAGVIGVCCLAAHVVPWVKDRIGRVRFIRQPHSLASYDWTAEDGEPFGDAA